MQTTFFDFQKQCKLCSVKNVLLFESWYADNYAEGWYCEPCIDGEHK